LSGRIGERMGGFVGRRWTRSGKLNRRELVSCEDAGLRGFSWVVWSN
jgi:hypothetical protein